MKPTRTPRAGSLFSGAGFGVGRIAGVAIQVDWSLLIIFVLIAVNLGGGVFPDWHPEWSAALTWGMAFGTAVLFFCSVLVHELAHAVVARRQGIGVDTITLFLFGGVAHMEREPETPKAEFLMAIVGPLTSVAIGVVATAAGVLLAGDAVSNVLSAGDTATVERSMRAIGPLATLLLWLGPINILLAVFNIIPGFPLDGGRVLRSILWRITGDLSRATRWASATGRAFAWALMILGALQMFAGALVQGVWLMLIGWFLNSAARRSYQQLLVHQALEGVPVTRVMRTELRHVDAALSIEQFVRDVLLNSDQLAFPVDADGVVIGVVDLDDVRKAPQPNWTDLTVRHIMTPLNQLPSLSADADAEAALQQMARGDVEQIPVMAADQLVGMVQRRDVIKWLALLGNVDRSAAGP